MLDEFEFKFHQEFFDDLDKLNKQELEAANKQIDKIKQNPLRYKRLRGRENCFSIRSGDLRIIYYVGGKIVWFLLVDRRDDVYGNYLKRLYRIKIEFGV